MRRRDTIKLAISSIATLPLIEKSLSSAGKSDSTRIKVDWGRSQAEISPFVFGSNDYEITIPERAASSAYQQRLAKLGIGLIRIHHNGLSDTWSDPATKTWNEAKIKAGYSVSYTKKPTIIQNIPGWPKWMAQNQEGLLDPSEYDNYATFCGQLVKIITHNLAQRQVIYWEPFNEKEITYQKAGKLDELWKIYNKAAIAMKAVNPRIKVGGPALNWNDTSKLVPFLKTCRANIDFISWHGYGTGNASESTAELMSHTSGYRSQVEGFRALTKQYIPDRKVPLLLGEYNINYSWDSGEKRQNTYLGAVWFASVLKHLGDAGIDMATSWLLKDGIYGMIDPENDLRPVAVFFSWGIKYLTGRIMYTESENPLIEAMAVRQSDDRRSLLLINKSDVVAKLSISAKQNLTSVKSIPVFYLNSNGVKSASLPKEALLKKPLILPPYSLALLRV
ncbi:alpha-L-arabinofuranosidase [Aetokthonos hydrillicola Thurmond2011]|jgi:xylan 1,4-beta-xylosidase|uniref:Alpha-L-arabinofuranosidase n=1 Tax=Aetokthonos hydrillicola Thurmond2011 TaxID=2712845 RepID=A0AAP5I4R3_9CYAN|nr:alpha-L-arabinofuranosidase [Aetokthonos hydrillicola]MBO3457557.1 alpha-L-arabinofuranosidase [Aetokthonos hydrillicola CCALA 1050]MBW4590767.1 alpha-L-arabinofuranosidase [Aetokthonos hydrillicola CCALA 1050]MDR9894761.1 alpha-L-arabinofuranosidase [Aetokthonos hydrillicola Thurmond2011]